MVSYYKSIWIYCAVVLISVLCIQNNSETFGACMVLAYKKTIIHVTQEVKLLQCLCLRCGSLPSQLKVPQYGLGSWNKEWFQYMSSQNNSSSCAKGRNTPLSTLSSLLASSSVHKGWTFTSTFPSMPLLNDGYLQFTPLSDIICIQLIRSYCFFCVSAIQNIPKSNISSGNGVWKIV